MSATTRGRSEALPIARPIRTDHDHQMFVDATREPAGLFFLQWMPPLQSAEAAEVAISRDPFTAVLDRHCSQKRVGDQISLCAGARAKPRENVPMVRTRRHSHAIRTFAKLVDELRRIRQLAGRLENAGVSNDSQESAQHEVR